MSEIRCFEFMTKQHRNEFLLRNSLCLSGVGCRPNILNYRGDPVGDAFRRLDGYHQVHIQVGWVARLCEVDRFVAREPARLAAVG